MIKEIIVVEGKDDTVAIARAVEAETIETGGSAIDADILRRIALAHERRGVIVFTDPDHAGERIRSMITEHVPGCKHAFLTREEAVGKSGGIGVEHASPEAIQRALANVKTVTQANESQITWDDLMQADLINNAGAAERRKQLGEILGIGYANGKQLYKRCRMFQIKREEFFRALQIMDNPRVDA